MEKRFSFSFIAGYFKNIWRLFPGLRKRIIKQLQMYTIDTVKGWYFDYREATVILKNQTSIINPCLIPSEARLMS